LYGFKGEFVENMDFIQKSHQISKYFREEVSLCEEYFSLEFKSVVKFNDHSLLEVEDSLTSDFPHKSHQKEEKHQSGSKEKKKKQLINPRIAISS
jgi:hypothetical protein